MGGGVKRPLTAKVFAVAEQFGLAAKIAEFVTDHVAKQYPSLCEPQEPVNPSGHGRIYSPDTYLGSGFINFLAPPPPAGVSSYKLSLSLMQHS
ncbi:hypothetical protein A2U01_0005676 [Trifolium medium]|uniref:Uncharacterized protein n=1 Tax=Trifolium medium TaxID=97028 RepID=A0A392MCQ1_9FABA|nr:hypothetical protein [Trifolium medium]